MALLPDLVRVLLSFSWMSFRFSSVIHLVLDELCLLALFPFGIVLLVLLVGSSLGGLPVPGCVVDLVTAGVRAVQKVVADGGCQEVFWVRSSGPGRKRIRLNRKPPAHLAGFAVQSRPRVWKRLHHVGFQMFLFLIRRGGVVIRMMRCAFLLRTGQGWVNSLGVCLPTSPGLHAL